MVKFKINGSELSANKDESIWQAAKRNNIDIPHLCHADEVGYDPNGNCRACVVQVKGERTMAASCIRKPSEGMEVDTISKDVNDTQKIIFELLAADQPCKENHPDPESKFWQWGEKIGLNENRFPKNKSVKKDISHPSMNVNLEACINCNLCVRACRDVQSNDVIGMAYRGYESKVIFDFDDEMASSTCVGCGECVQACPTGALMEKSLLDENGNRDTYPDKTVNSLCPYCGVGCQTKVFVKNNKIVQVDGRDGPANNQKLCVKGRFGFDYIHNKGRLTKPLIRKNKVKKEAINDYSKLKISDYFREASWEEVIKLSALRLKSIHDSFGSSAVCGFGSAKGSNEEAYLFQKLIRTAFQTNNIDHCTRLCHASSVAALMECVGSGAVSAPFTAVNDSDCMIIIGARPTTNHPVAATYFKRAAKDGKKLIIMDPRTQDLTRHAYKHLQFKPGKDVALLNALIYTIIEEDLYDKQYVASMTEGFDALKKNINKFKPEDMEGICGIKAKDIRDVARVYATSDKSIIFWGMGISQHIHGTDNSRCLITLALITGHIGRPGTGLHPLRGQNNVQGASDAGLIPMVFPDYQPVEDKGIHQNMEKFWDTKLDDKKGLTVVEIIDGACKGKIKGMYVMGENPVMSDPDQNHTIEGICKLDTLVVQDIFMTETAWYADIILPASAHAEKNGTFTNTNRQVQMGRKVVDAPGDAKEDLDIIIDLGNALGLNWTYKHVSEVFNEMASIMPSLNNITWDRVDKEESVTYPCEATDQPGTEIVFSQNFPTNSGLGKIVPTNIISPDELPDQNFPFVLTTGRLLEHWHTGSMTRKSETLDKIEPEAIVSMNSQDMNFLKLEPGNKVTVKTRRGSVTLSVRQDRELPKGMIFIPFCFSEAAANKLTNPQLDPYGKIPEFKYCAANIEAC
jgi:formate dehydrogenase major subunit